MKTIGLLKAREYAQQIAPHVKKIAKSEGDSHWRIFDGEFYFKKMRNEKRVKKLINLVLNCNTKKEVFNLLVYKNFK